jgi:hypothetical protein
MRELLQILIACCCAWQGNTEVLFYLVVSEADKVQKSMFHSMLQAMPCMPAPHAVSLHRLVPAGHDCYRTVWYPNAHTFGVRSAHYCHINTAAQGFIQTGL